MQGNTVTIGRMFREGWTCFKARPWFWIGIIILCVVIEQVIGTVASTIVELVSPDVRSGDFNWGGFIVLLVLGILVQTRIQMGLMWMGVITVDGKTAKIRDLLAKPHLFWRFLFASILFNLMVMVGMILLIVPGIYLFARFLPLNFVLIERETGILDSFRQAQRLTEGHRGKLITLMLLGVAAMFVLMVGFMALTTVLQSLAPLAVPFAFILVFPLIILIGTPVVMLTLASIYRTLRNASTNQALPA